MYKHILLKEAFSVRKIISVHYFEYSKNFSFEGESHDFWELVYVDKGEVDILSDTQEFRLERGEFAFHKPNEWHSIKSTGEVAPNLIILSFICSSKYMDFFNDKTLRTTDIEKGLLSIIIKEAYNSFSTPLNDPTTTSITRKKCDTSISEQLIKISIEQLLIMLYKNNKSTNQDFSIIKRNQDKSLIDEAKSFLKQNVGKKLKFEDVCNNLNVSGASLKKVFKAKTGYGVMEYFINLKIERAKQYIRQETYNFTQISQKLGYDTLHHFTKQFKEKTSMTPTEYSLSVNVSSYFN